MSAPDVLTAGEALIDWVSRERGADLAAATVFTRAPGGAPLNVAVGLARLGQHVGFAGCLADDPFGDELAALLRQEQVDDRCVRRVAGSQTRMAYVVTREDGDRELAAFGRGGCADEELRPHDVPDTMLEGLAAYYFGTLPLAAEPSGAAVLETAARARAHGALVFFDPNIRPVLWPETPRLIEKLRATLELAHVVKLGSDELSALTGTEDLEPGAARLLAEHPLDAVVVTYGSAGAGVRVRDGACLHVPAPKVMVQDATGAGDGFVAALLDALLDARRPGEPLAGVLARWQAADWEAALARANAVGAMVTTRAGALTALPRRDELQRFIANLL